MPFVASSAAFGTPPRDKMDLNARYVVQVTALREKEMPNYNDPSVMDPKIIWTLQVHRARFGGEDGTTLTATTPVIAADGGIYSHDVITGINVHPSKPGKTTAKARVYAEAVLGRDPKVAVEKGEDLIALLTNRFAFALFDMKVKPDGSSDLAILKLSTIEDQRSVGDIVALGIGSASLERIAPVAAAPVAAPAPAAPPAQLPW